MFRIALKSLAVTLALAGVSNAQEKKGNEVPPPRPVPAPMVLLLNSLERPTIATQLPTQS